MKMQILDIEDVARLKGVHPGTVYHWVAKGILKPIKTGRSLFFIKKHILRWQPPKRGRKRKEVMRNDEKGTRGRE